MSRDDSAIGAAPPALAPLIGREAELSALARALDAVERERSTRTVTLVGPPGIVLIGEGNPNRLKPLVASERRKHERVASEVPIHEVYVGNGEGQVPLRKLLKHVTKLGKSLKPAQMTDVLQRLKALDSQRGNIPLPKGPVPTSMKGMRGNLRGR